MILLIPSQANAMRVPLLSILVITLSIPALAAEPPGFKIQLDVLSKGYDGKTCWVHPRAGAIPGKSPSVVLTMQKLLLTGSDVFFALNEMRSDDLGKTWSGPTEHGETLGRRSEPGGVIVATCDFTPKWHAKSGKLLGTGQTVRYLNDKVIPERDRETSYSVYDPAARTWTPWTTLDMPDPAKFQSAGAGSVQRLDLPSGDILLPIYYKNQSLPRYRTTVLRCSFDGAKLKFAEQGNELTVDVGRGLYEPSITVYQGRYYLTLRNDAAGYVATSKDGLTFSEPQKWLWDDGTDLGNYNTQQHWVTHSSGLFLVYTRKGASNDHVFRHRAPLFIAQVDPEKLRVIRSTERILVPERGARLGNFAVTIVSERETWVTVAEWMQTWGPNHVLPVDNKYGSDNSVYAARISWDAPNKSWDQY
ncbi:MAG: sialidase family protein [Pirellulaceae bacterium]|nr:sialidase family protein [Pirellulaceae bacterium]